MFCANVTSAVLKVASAGTEVLVAAGSSPPEQAASARPPASRTPAKRAECRRAAVVWQGGTHGRLLGGWPAQGPARADGVEHGRRQPRGLGAAALGLDPQHAETSRFRGGQGQVDGGRRRRGPRPSRAARRPGAAAGQPDREGGQRHADPAREDRQADHQRVHRRGVPVGAPPPAAWSAMSAPTWTVDAPGAWAAWPSAVAMFMATRRGRGPCPAPARRPCTAGRASRRRQPAGAVPSPAETSPRTSCQRADTPPRYLPAPSDRAD